MSENDDDVQLSLSSITLPISVIHVKHGNTLCTNEDSLLLQDGSTTIELRIPPKFEVKKIPWRNGLVRDIDWCSELDVYILLTQKGLFTFDPQTLIAPSLTTINNDIQSKIVAYNRIEPYDEECSFWRCACVGTKVYISYSGFGSVIEEYSISPSSSELTKRWIPPKTCDNHEGIWCIRYHPDTDQLGMTIMDGRTNQWRFEIRSRKNLSTVWQTVLPLTHGDYELSPLLNGEWLTINSCGIRLIHIADCKITEVVEYKRELKNAITFGNKYLFVRTKNTLEIHRIKKNKN